jgi:coenzyme PQQ biosynthesis protein PqqD
MDAIKLCNGVRIQRDDKRNQYVVQLPEEILVPSETALAVLNLIDNVRSERDICEILSETFDAPYFTISNDVAEFFEKMRKQRVIV